MSPKIVFVMGATATGKSEWALRVAERAGAVIVNCDSVQVYKGARIGASQPSEADLQRAPHFLYDYVQCPQEMSAGTFRRDFFETIRGLPADSRVLAVGGTGFYFRALEKGMFDVPTVAPEVAEQIRTQLEDPEGRQALREELETGDPAAAEKISKEDSYRLARAVELLRSGVLPSEVQKNFTPAPFPWALHKTCLWKDRSKHRERMEARTRGMLKAGLLEETRGLLALCAADWAPLRAVGYKQAVEFLGGDRSEEWLVEEITLRTFQLAKRQNTWFKKEENCLFFDAETEQDAFQDSCLRFFDL